MTELVIGDEKNTKNCLCSMILSIQIWLFVKSVLKKEEKKGYLDLKYAQKRLYLGTIVFEKLLKKSN